MPLSPITNGLSPAGDALGLGDLLTEQVAGETEEMRRKRMQELQNRRMMGQTGSMAVTSLFGDGMSGIRSYGGLGGL